MTPTQDHDEHPVTARCHAPAPHALALAGARWWPRPMTRAAARSVVVRRLLACRRRELGAFVSTWCPECRNRRRETWCTPCTRLAHAATRPGRFTYRAYCARCQDHTAITTVTPLTPA